MMWVRIGGRRWRRWEGWRARTVLRLRCQYLCFWGMKGWLTVTHCDFSNEMISSRNWPKDSREEHSSRYTRDSTVSFESRYLKASLAGKTENPPGLIRFWMSFSKVYFYVP